MRQPDFWWSNTPVARAAATALAPLGVLYGASVALKNRRQRARARVPVICVGNLTVGGSGKTPVAVSIARLLQRNGVTPAFVSRGYGRETKDVLVVDPDLHDVSAAGDEALLLARVAPTIVSIDRAAGASIAESLGAMVIIMDDGHQNFSLHKDLSIVVVDGETGFGNERIVPAGPLREPVQKGLRRADAVVVMGDGDPPLAGFSGPVLRAHLTPMQHLGGQRVVGFAGIGRPEKFFATVRESGAALVEARAFPDHHVYTAAEIVRLRDRATAADAALITTEKDFVRLLPKDREAVQVLAVRATFDDETAVTKLVSSLIASPTQR